MKTEKTLKLFHIVAWMVCIGILMKAGGIIISYFVSTETPEVSKNLYKGMNLFQLYQFSFIHYSAIVFYKISLLLLQAYIAFLIATFLNSFSLDHPFSTNLLKLLNKFNSTILILWGIVILHNAHLTYLEKTQEIRDVLISSDFVLLSGFIFILTIIFKRGIELQTENELTI
jgi:hypothetical protein